MLHDIANGARFCCRFDDDIFSDCRIRRMPRPLLPGEVEVQPLFSRHKAPPRRRSRHSVSSRDAMIFCVVMRWQSREMFENARRAFYASYAIHASHAPFYKVRPCAAMSPRRAPRRILFSPYRRRREYTNSQYLMRENFIGR